MLWAATSPDVDAEGFQVGWTAEWLKGLFTHVADIQLNRPPTLTIPVTPANHPTRRRTQRCVRSAVFPRNGSEDHASQIEEQFWRNSEIVIREVVGEDALLSWTQE